MHPNRVFHTHSDQKNLAFARERGFGILAVNGQNGPLMSHVPLLVSEDRRTVDMHLVRSNPIFRLLKEPLAARIAISGPDSYISPDWYEIDDQVPTWNYIAVHIWGRLEALPQNELKAVLDHQSAHFEEQLRPKRPWTLSKMSEKAKLGLMRAIVPVRLNVEGVDGTWKLNQNKDDDVRLRAALAVSEHGIGSGLSDLAEQMRNPSKTKE